MNVYLAVAGEYSDYRVLHAFSKREDAESYFLGDAVEELQVHDAPVEVRRWHQLRWHSGRPDGEGVPGTNLANPWSDNSEFRDFTGKPGHVEHRWAGAMLIVEGWDAAAVGKVFSEQRAMRRAQQDLEHSPAPDA